MGLGVLMERDNTVKRAGGFIVQLMPDATEEIIEKLEANLAQITVRHRTSGSGGYAEMILEKLLEIWTWKSWTGWRPVSTATATRCGWERF